MSAVWNRALADVAARWADPEHPPRAEAEEETLEASSSFTEEGLAFDVNVVMDLLASGRFSNWLGDVPASERRTVGVVSTGRTPTEGLLVLAAATALGHEGVASTASGSPALLPAFFDEVAEEAGEGSVRFVERRDLFKEAEALIGRGTGPEREVWARQAEEQGIPPARQLLEPVQWGVGVLDGRESRAELSGLAEDVLLHEGGTPRSIRLLWAPDELAPDELLDVLAAFREEYPPHPATDGTLKMPAAFLGASKQPHALGPGFLISKGAPEPQDGAHLRWSGYETLADVVAWIQEHREQVGFVAARPAVAEGLRGAGLPGGVPVLAFGDAHRVEPSHPPLTEETRRFLLSL